MFGLEVSVNQNNLENRSESCVSVDGVSKNLLRLSKLTERENQRLEFKFSKLHGKSDMSKQTDFIQQLQGTKVLLKAQDKEIKVMNYMLSRLVQAGDTHINFSLVVPTTVDVIEQTPIFCKVNTEGREPPLKIKLDFKSGEESDLKIFASDKCPEPNEANKTHFWQDKKVLYIKPPVYQEKTKK